MHVGTVNRRQAPGEVLVLHIYCLQHNENLTTLTLTHGMVVRKSCCAWPPPRMTSSPFAPPCRSRWTPTHNCASLLSSVRPDRNVSEPYIHRDNHNQMVPINRLEEVRDKWACLAMIKGRTLATNVTQTYYIHRLAILISLFLK